MKKNTKSKFISNKKSQNKEGVGNLSIHLSQIANSAPQGTKEIRISDINKDIIKEISITVSKLNLNFFLTRFRNLDFQYAHCLIESKTEVSNLTLPILMTVRFLMILTEQVSAVSSWVLTNYQCINPELSCLCQECKTRVR